MDIRMSTNLPTQTQSPLSGLTTSQRAAATSRASHSLVLAGPGSGKTSTIVARGHYLLSTAPEHRIAVVTFTRASAEEVNDRLTHAQADMTRCMVGTFHSLSLRMLRQFGLNVHRDNVLLPEEQDRFLEHAMASCRWPGTLTQAKRALEQSGARISNTFDSHEIRLLAEYADLLRKSHRIDFPDLIKRVLLDKTIRPLQAHHLLVDEAQDIDEWQLAWILRHAAAGLDTTIVADDDQSIYGFRYAMGVRGLRRYSRVLNQVQQFVLEENFRSGQQIVDLAQTLIHHDNSRIKKVVRCRVTFVASLGVHEATSLEDELLRIALKVKESPGEWAVLAHTNIQLERIELALIQRGIPYWIDSKSDIWKSGLGAALLALLRSLLASEPMSELWTALIDLRCPMVGDPPTCTAGQMMLDHAWSSSLFSTQSSLSDEQVAALQDLPKRWSNWFSEQRRATKAVVKDIAKWVRPFVCGKEARLYSALATCLEKRRGGIEHRILCRKLKADKPNGVVTLSTLHKSKGLEFERVWICGLDARDDHDPTYDVCEDRRLLYVGFTRAKRELFVSYEKTYGPSSLLLEAGLSAKSRTRRTRQSHFR